MFLLMNPENKCFLFADPYTYQICAVNNISNDIQIQYFSTFRLLYLNLTNKFFAGNHHVSSLSKPENQPKSS